MHPKRCNRQISMAICQNSWAALLKHWSYNGLDWDINVWKTWLTFAVDPVQNSKMTTSFIKGGNWTEGFNENETDKNTALLPTPVLIHHEHQLIHVHCIKHKYDQAMAAFFCTSHLYCLLSTCKGYHDLVSGVLMGFSFQQKIVKLDLQPIFFVTADGMAPLEAPCHQLSQIIFLHPENHFSKMCAPAWSPSKCNLHKVNLIFMLVKETTKVHLYGRALTL